MDERPNAYQCLPLVIANQWGWQVLCPTDVRVTWDGTPGLDGLRVEVAPQYTPAIKSQFGSGIVTFSPPWLFRTPPGWDLYLKGPSNRWKPNCHPLEGVIETWWLNYTFTLNWKLVEPGTVVFARGESLGQLVPVPHATFEEATALEAPIGLLEPQAARELLEWLRTAPAARRPGGQRPPPLPQGRGRRRPPPEGRRAGDRVDLAVKAGPDHWQTRVRLPRRQSIWYVQGRSSATQGDEEDIEHEYVYCHEAGRGQRLRLRGVSGTTGRNRDRPVECPRIQEPRPARRWLHVWHDRAAAAIARADPSREIIPGRYAKSTSRWKSRDRWHRST